MNLDTLESKTKDSGGKFVRLKDNGQKLVCAFVGDFVEETTYWLNDQKVDKGTPGAEASTKFLCNVFVPADGAIQVFTFNKTCAKAIVPSVRKYGADHVYEITRTGEPRSPKATYSVLPEAPLTPEQKQKIASLELHDLAA